MNETAKYTALEALYGRVPSIQCRGLCQDSCEPVGGLASRLENKRVLTLYGKGPRRTDGRCNRLTPDGKCSVYEHRPLICRMWGTTEQMTCPHGCRPERVLSFDEARDLWAESIAIGGAP
jgi:uncharacterized protein